MWNEHVTISSVAKEIVLKVLTLSLFNPICLASVPWKFVVPHQGGIKCYYNNVEVSMNKR